MEHEHVEQQEPVESEETQHFPRAEAHVIGEPHEAEEMGSAAPWGCPIVLPNTGSGDFWYTGAQSQAHTTTIRTGWLKGLEHMERVNPREWAKQGVKAGRRVPCDFRAFYRSISLSYANATTKRCAEDGLGNKD